MERIGRFELSAKAFANVGSLVREELATAGGSSPDDIPLRASPSENSPLLEGFCRLKSLLMQKPSARIYHGGWVGGLGGGWGTTAGGPTTVVLLRQRICC